MRWWEYRSSFGEPLAVVLAPQPQHVLCTVEKLRETVELAVTEVDGSLKTHQPIRGQRSKQPPRQVPCP